MSEQISRPDPRIVHRFEVVATSSGLVMGDFKWAVLNGIAVVHDGLMRNEAEILAQVLNRQLGGFREAIGLQAYEPRQLLLVLPPMLLGGSRKIAPPKVEQKETKRKRAA
jgi:hypothetical protein